MLTRPFGHPNGHQESGNPGTVTALRYIAYATFIALAVVVAYGLYSFPAAPIRYVDGQYVDKLGHIHSREDFERLHAWEFDFVLSWIVAAAGGVSYRYAKRGGSTGRLLRPKRSEPNS